MNEVKRAGLCEYPYGKMTSQQSETVVGLEDEGWKFNRFTGNKGAVMLHPKHLEARIVPWYIKNSEETDR